MGLFDRLMGKSGLEEGLREYRAAQDALLGGVLTRGEYRRGQLKGSVNLPLAELSASKLPQGKTLYVYCQSGARSGAACRLLKSKGYEARNIGGLFGYAGELEKGERA